MESSIERALGIYEILERIILQLNSLDEIFRAQRVCGRWSNIIQNSLALHQACWYQPHDRDSCQQRASPQKFKLNPAFNRLGISEQIYSYLPQQEQGNFDLTKRIYDKPGSWTTMLATQPPCRCIEVECYSDYSMDESISYLIESTRGCLLLGDVMAVLAECQNRQDCGVDRWGSQGHFTGRLHPITEKEWDVPEKEWDYYNWQLHLKEIPDNVSVKVAVEVPWGNGIYPAFALRRLYPHAEQVDYPFRGGSFLHELIIYRMIDHRGEYRWEGRDWDRRDWESDQMRRIFKLGKYEANLVAVKEHPEGYLAEYSRTLRSLSNVNEYWY